MLDFSNRLRELRNEKKVSQQQLADFLGLHQTTVKDWETKGNQPKYEILIKTAQFFNVTVGQLLGTEEL